MSVVICDSVVHLSIRGSRESDSQQIFFFKKNFFLKKKMKKYEKKKNVKKC